MICLDPDCRNEQYFSLITCYKINLKELSRYFSSPLDPYGLRIEKSIPNPHGITLFDH